MFILQTSSAACLVMNVSFVVYLYNLMVIVNHFWLLVGDFLWE